MGGSDCSKLVYRCHPRCHFLVYTWLVHAWYKKLIRANSCTQMTALMICWLSWWYAHAASSRQPDLITRKVFNGLEKYPYVEPYCTKISQKLCKAFKCPLAAASSAHQCAKGKHFHLLQCYGIRLSMQGCWEHSLAYIVNMPWVGPLLQTVLFHLTQSDL